MVKDLNIPIEIVGCPIVREESGLALSSRNSYLSNEEKEDALALSKILFNIKNCYKKGITDAKALKETAFNYDIYITDSKSQMLKNNKLYNVNIVQVVDVFTFFRRKFVGTVCGALFLCHRC